MTFEFDEDTAVRRDPDTPGRWHGELTDRWDIGDKPNGGYILATALRGIGEALPAHPDPFTVTAHYLRPGEHLPCAIDVDVVRTGRKLATVTAVLSQEGKTKIHVLASFGDLAAQSGPTTIRATPPDLPPVTECVSRNAFPLSTVGATPSSMGERIHSMLHPETGWCTGKPTGIAEVRGWMRFADGREPDALSLALFSDAMPPAVFELMEERVWVPTIELTVHVRARPAPGLLRARMSTRFLQNGYLEEDGELWDSTGTLVAQSRQLGMLFVP